MLLSATCDSTNSIKLFVDTNYIDDGGISTDNAVQAELPNHSKVLHSKDIVLSVREKAKFNLSGMYKQKWMFWSYIYIYNSKKIMRNLIVC